MIFLTLLLLLTGCGGSKELHSQRSLSLQKKLLFICQEIESIHDLNERKQELKTNITLLTDQIISADKFYRESGVEPPLIDDYSASLQLELRRIYALPGAREVIERLEKENLIKLDAYSQSITKR